MSVEATRACACGAGLIVTIADSETTALIDDWERAHHGPGHELVQRPESQLGRAPRKPRPRKERAS